MYRWIREFYGGGERGGGATREARVQFSAVINFTAVRPHTLLGRLLRLPLRLIPGSAVVRIPQGPGRGLRWRIGAAMHGYWLGTYEPGSSGRFVREVSPGDVVYDMGANVGWYTLLAARRVGGGGHVVAIEPLPENVRQIRDHLALNRFENVTVVNAAVGAESGEVRFARGGHHSLGRIEDTGDLAVRVVRIDDLVARGELPPPTLVKIDVEGAEVMALEGMRATLAAHRPFVFLSTHGASVHQQCIALLRQLGYELCSLSAAPLDTTEELLATHRGDRPATRGGHPVPPHHP